ncbi:amino acid permease [Streptomyces sp. DHE17-7]|uniref:amino acid permease n=1 Tax=Streptomyces sp. DHE17-7 TaxID=2759949 RepID=UPI0022EB0C13|nr:amino acid permease [Streptomyces sp. DHE17-7]
MLATVFVFLGVEGASVYSRHAERRSDVGRATVLGFLSVFAVFASVTIVSYGIMPMAEIAELRQPSMAGVLEEAVGTWGRVFVSVGLIVSVLGAYLAWTLMAPKVFFRRRRRNVSTCRASLRLRLNRRRTCPVAGLCLMTFAGFTSGVLDRSPASRTTPSTSRST